MLRFLSNIHIIMVGTTLPANIGSAARAMHTMGLSQLGLVAPKLPIDDTSYANAAGGTSVLDTAVTYPDLASSIGECSLVLAASARTRHLPRPIITPTQGADLLARFFHQNPNAKVAILFGREDRGLTNEELAMADYHIQIPANSDYPVLNVASAVQVIAATIFAHFDEYRLNNNDNVQKNYEMTLYERQIWDEPPITHAQKDKLENSVIELMARLSLTHDELKDLPTRLSRLTSRVQLDKKEYTILMSIIHKLNQKL